VGLDKMAGSEGAQERELPGHDSRGNDPSERLSVLAGLARVGSLDSEHLEDSLLWGEDGASTHCSDLDARHVDSHQEIFTAISSVDIMRMISCVAHERF
jgi:hypothetical protein